jgi:hypothetical protein
LSKEHVATIALAHVLFFNSGRELITANSDKLFLGLGIEPKASRRRLLKRAKDLYYVGCDGLGDFLAQIERVDFDERYGNTDRDWEAEEGPTPRSGMARGMVIIIIIATLGVGIWLSININWR